MNHRQLHPFSTFGFRLSTFLPLLFLSACTTPDAPIPLEPGWHSLFDGQELGNWEVTNFGGEGEVLVRDGRIVVKLGNELSGITWNGDFPTQDYELALEAQRMQGRDFFCGLTFPIGDSHCSLIVGGWGGTVVGLSSINGNDASENETTTYQRFEQDRWYRIRLRVAAGRIQAWIDEDLVVDVPTRDRDFEVRPEVRLSRPLGIATWQTTAGLRRLRFKSLQSPGLRP